MWKKIKAWFSRKKEGPESYFLNLFARKVRTNIGEKLASALEKRGLFITFCQHLYKMLNELSKEHPGDSTIDWTHVKEVAEQFLEDPGKRDEIFRILRAKLKADLILSSSTKEILVPAAFEAAQKLILEGFENVVSLIANSNLNDFEAIELLKLAAENKELASLLASSKHLNLKQLHSLLKHYEEREEAQAQAKRRHEEEEEEESLGVFTIPVERVLYTERKRPKVDGIRILQNFETLRWGNKKIVLLQGDPAEFNEIIKSGKCSFYDDVLVKEYFSIEKVPDGVYTLRVFDRGERGELSDIVVAVMDDAEEEGNSQSHREGP